MNAGIVHGNRILALFEARRARKRHTSHVRRVLAVRVLSWRARLDPVSPYRYIRPRRHWTSQRLRTSRTCASGRRRSRWRRSEPRMWHTRAGAACSSGGRAGGGKWPPRAPPPPNPQQDRVGASPHRESVEQVQRTDRTVRRARAVLLDVFTALGVVAGLTGVTSICGILFNVYIMLYFYMSPYVGRMIRLLGRREPASAWRVRSLPRMKH